MQAAETPTGLSFNTVSAPQRESGSRNSNVVLSWVLLIVLALAPLPLGSNRPAFWAINAVIIGLAGLVYFTYMASSRQSFRVPLAAMRMQVIGFILLCAFLIFQVLPVSALLGLPTLADTGTLTIASDTPSIAPGATLFMLLRMVTYGLFFLLMLQVVRRSSRAYFLLDALLVVIALYAFVGIVSLQFGDRILGMPKWAYFGSATGTFVNRNSFATFLAFGATIAAAQIVSGIIRTKAREIRWSSMVLYGTAYLLIMSTLVATQSRMGLFVGVLGSLVPVLLAGLGNSVRNRTLVVAVVALLGAAAAAFLLFGSNVTERLGNVEQSGSVRLALYEQVLALISERPLLGFGGGTFELAFPLIHTLPVSPDLFWDKAHNTYLSLWAELGLVAGSLIPLCLILTAGKILVSLFRGTGSWTAQTIALSALIVGAVHSLVDFSLEIQANTFMLLALLAIGFASAYGGSLQQQKGRAA